MGINWDKIKQDLNKLQDVSKDLETDNEIEIDSGVNVENLYLVRVPFIVSADSKEKARQKVMSSVDIHEFVTQSPEVFKIRPDLEGDHGR